MGRSEATKVRRPQDGRAAWRAADVAAAEREWHVELDDAQRRAIADAARCAADRGVAIHAMTADQFPVDGLGEVIQGWSAMLETGLGFVLLSGFPIDLLDAHEVELAYVGIGTHLGTPVGQNRDGDVLTHVRDERLPASAGRVRLYRTRERQDFHTDGADIIGLLCLHQARRGGASKIASSWAIHNEMLARRPDLLDVLAQPMAWDRQGDVPPGESPWFTLSPLTEVAGVARLFYIGWYIRDSQQHSDAPRLSDAQLEAMAMLEGLANDPGFHVRMDFEPGDVQLINNGRILHAREAYDDDPDPERRRHLLRLWLAAHRFASLEPQLRRGIGEVPARP
jgi:hypothetical protein